MQVTSLDPLTATTTADPHRQSLANDFDNFLTMLTTQLQHQDPLSPLDSTEFTNQLVQFSQLEQQINQSEKLDNLIAKQQSAETAAALGYLGNEVEVISPVTVLTNGEARFAYTLPKGAVKTSIAILDESGSVVRTFDGETAAGRHDVTWDGTNDQGVTLPDGAYTIAVSAANEEDTPLTDLTVYSRGVADGIVTEDGITYLRVGNVNVPLDRVVAVTPDSSSTS